MNTFNPTRFGLFGPLLFVTVLFDSIKQRQYLKKIELSEIASVLRRHNIKLIGVGVEEMGSTEFVEKQFFDGDLYYVKDKSTYNTLGFKKFNKVSILASLFWKQSREALSKGQDMGLGGDLKGDWGQTGGAVLVEKGGKLLTYFAQTGPGDHLPNLDILKHFGLENEYLPDKMGNKSAVERGECLAAALSSTPKHDRWPRQGHPVLNYDAPAVGARDARDKNGGPTN
ncbi:hypothetical protein ACJJTC_013080 [Scirpophaga incertulas]